MASDGVVKSEVRSAKRGMGTVWWWAAVVAMSVAAVLAGACSGGGDGDERDAGTATATATATATSGVRGTGTATASASSTLTATQTPAATGTASGVTEVAQTTATVTALTPTPVPATATATSVRVTPTATLEPVADGTFVVKLSQGGSSANVRVEIAATAAERQLGLMYRTEIAEDAGMLFLFPRVGQGGFWMRNTLIPLDIAYIGADLKVIDIKHGVPLDETPLTPSAPYLYVLEVNGGWFERHGMGPGAVVTLPGGLPTPTDR